MSENDESDKNCGECTLTLQVMEGLIDHLMTCSRLNQTKLQSLKVCVLLT